MIQIEPEVADISAAVAIDHHIIGIVRNERAKLGGRDQTRPASS